MNDKEFKDFQEECYLCAELGDKGFLLLQRCYEMMIQARFKVRRSYGSSDITRDITDDGDNILGWMGELIDTAVLHEITCINSFADATLIQMEAARERIATIKKVYAGEKFKPRYVPPAMSGGMMPNDPRLN